jgi:hypothetical protein
MFSFIFLPWWVFLLGLAIQKTKSPTKKTQQRRIRRFRVVCPYSLPDGVELWKLRMRERYGSPYPGAPEQWYLEEIVDDVVTGLPIERGNYSIHKVMRYGLKPTASRMQNRIYPIYSNLFYDDIHCHDVYNCVAFYKEGWEYLDFSPFRFSANGFYLSMNKQQKRRFSNTRWKTETLKIYKPSLPKIEE